MHLRLLHRAQQGFTTVTLMGTLLVGGLLVAATFTAVQPDIAFTKKDEDGKQAYAAAESGLNYYLNRLGQDNSYYVRCTNVPSPTLNAVNTEWWPAPAAAPATPTADPRRWQTIQGSTAQYTVELLAVQDADATREQCVENQPDSMIDPKTGTFRIRATGRARPPSGGAACTTNTPSPPATCRPTTRSIIATLRRKSFIDFLWFTDFETADPYSYDLSDQTWALANCANKYRPQRDGNCNDQNFITGDALNGPFKTNDSISVCGDPSFGRDSDDDIELNQDSPGWEASCGGSSPDFKGTIVYPAGVLPMPQSNAALEAAADPGYVFNGETRLVFNGSTVSITNNGTTVSKALPPSGVIYVNNTTGCNPYDFQQTYPNTTPNPPTTNGYMQQPGCGNVWVQGTYNSDITIGADNDIIVTDDLKASPAFDTASTSSTVLAGLIANNFVRVFHPANFSTDWRGNLNCDSNNGGPGSIQIDAAILALNHSFLVDNYYCGSPLGTLTVNGAIAQKYRGTVGQHNGGTPIHGYSKNYVYNKTLRYREPPYFINPTDTAWRVVRQSEQVPGAWPNSY